MNSEREELVKRVIAFLASAAFTLLLFEGIRCCVALIAWDISH